jgi:arginase
VVPVTALPEFSLRGKDIVAIGVPIDCVGTPEIGDPAFGTELAPAALRDAGLLAVLRASDAGDLPVRLVGAERDPGTGVLGWPSVQQVTETVGQAVGGVLRNGQLPFLLGGCCTLLPAALAAARVALEAGVGLAYLDGHLDLYDGRTSPTGEPADMPIAVITGHGPAAWVELVGAPIVEADRLLLIGPRDREEALTYGSVMPEDLGQRPEWTPSDLRQQGPTAAGELAAASLGDFWLHLDVDVLDETAFPATDYLMPGGLQVPELTELMRPLLISPRLIGASIACYNPQKDPDGSCAQALVELFTPQESP